MSTQTDAPVIARELRRAALKRAAAGQVVRRLRRTEEAATKRRALRLVGTIPIALALLLGALVATLG